MHKIRAKPKIRAFKYPIHFERGHDFSSTQSTDSHSSYNCHSSQNSDSILSQFQSLFRIEIIDFSISYLFFVASSVWRALRGSEKVTLIQFVENEIIVLSSSQFSERCIRLVYYSGHQIYTCTFRCFADF